MGHFVPSPGMVNCPKCFGWQIRDLTKRDAKGWPKEPERIVDCDHCNGRGEIPGVNPTGVVRSPFATAVPVVPVEPVKRGRGRPRKVDVTNLPINDIDDEPKPEPKAACWHLNKKEVWGATVCADCGAKL